MKKLSKLGTVFFAIVGVFIFGAWTPDNVNESIRYTDAAIVSTCSSENVYFTSRSRSEENYTPKNCPLYRCLSGLENVCGAVAGSMIIGYYDKYFPNLIPNWESYYSNGSYRLQDTVCVPDVISQLYTLMRTNVDDVGVSEEDFVDGLTSYINNKGYSVNYQNLVSGSDFNYDEYKRAINDGKVVALLTKQGEVYDLKFYESYDCIEATTVTDPHIMVAYGYLKIDYYDASGIFRTDTYLRVALGITSKNAYYKINNNNNITGAYIVNIS